MKYSALTWVKTTIDENLKQTLQALKQFIDSPSETTPLQQCLVWLHEIHGTLNILNLQTAALLVQDLELTIKSLIEGQIENNQSTYEVLMRTLSQLPNYLDHLTIVQRDIPLALLPLLNDLRALRQQPPLAAYDFFTPDLSVAIPHQKAVNLPDEKLKEYMQKMRVAYQKGLATIVKTPKQPAEGLKFLYTVMQRLQQATGTAPVSKVWWVTGGVVEALLQKGLEVNKSNFNLLKQLDALINQIVQHGNTALRVEPPKALLTNLLYYAALARSKGKQITAVKTIFQLNNYLPPESTLAAAKWVFAGPDIDLMKVVVTLLKDDFVRVQETLDIFNRADNPAMTELTPLVTRLRDMAKTLELLGLGGQSQSMLAQAALIHEISEGSKPPEFSTLLDIANALLKIEAAVDILAVQGVHARQRLASNVETEFSETPQFNVMLKVAIDEAKKELAQAIEPLINLIENDTQDENLSKVPESLKLVAGLLSTLYQENAAQLLVQCNKYIENVFIGEGTVPTDENKRQALADVLIGIEIYLDTLADNSMDAVEILSFLSSQFSLLSAS